MYNFTRKLLVVDELLLFNRLNINEFVHSAPQPSNQWMEFHITYSYNVSGNGMVMHIKVCPNDFIYKGVNAI